MIELINGYYAGADSKQYIVGRPYVGKDQKTRFRDPHYFSTMTQAAKYLAARFLREKVAAKEITTLQEFLREAKRLREDFTRKLEELEV